MLDLSTVTLFCADGYDAARCVPMMERMKSYANFGAVKLLTHHKIDYEHRVEIMPLLSLLDYSIWMLKCAANYVDTPHMLVVQNDGFIINPSAWQPEWLQHDYIGPLFIQDHPYETKVGSGGFSLRTKKLMQYVQKRTPEWCSSADTERVQRQLGAYEDGYICMRLRLELLNAGFKFAPPAEAAKFAQGGYPHVCSANPQDRTYYVERPFGHHGGWRTINRETGFVSPPPFI